MKIVALIDSFKNSFSSQEACNALEEALTTDVVDAFPVSDGGENTVDNLMALYHGERIESLICGPDGSVLNSYFAYIEASKTAIIESAEGAGIQKIVVGQHPLTALSSFGVGQQIQQALDLGVSRIILGLGGTCTIDGGLGLLSALGVRFYAKNGTTVNPYSFELGDVDAIDLNGLDIRLKSVEIILASDVDNPLNGMNGAVYTFGPQKGLPADQLEVYDESLSQYALKLSEATGTAYREAKHTGAAGGIGFALMCIASCKWVRGYSLFLGDERIRHAVQNCDYILSGEGKFDHQSLNGKLISGVLELADEYHKPVVLVCGLCDLEVLPERVEDVICISDDAENLEDSIQNGIHYFKAAVKKWLLEKTEVSGDGVS